MKNIFHNFMLLLMLSCLIFIQNGCVQNKGSGKLAGNEEATPLLRVGISPNAPPLAYKAGGKLQGLEVDFANQLGSYLGKKIKFIQLDWERQLPSLEEGKIDIIMSGMTITPKRSYRVSFAEPYMRSGQILLVRSDDARRYSSGIYSIMGKSPAIGTIKNTTGDFFISKTINRPNLTRFPASDKAVKALISRKIDVFVHDAPIICHFAAIHESDRLTPILQMATEEYLAWAVNKMDTELLEQVNGFIKSSIENRKLEQTVKRWIPYL